MNGYLVSLYPAGAMIAAPVFGWAVREFGVRATLGGLAAVLAVAARCHPSASLGDAAFRTSCSSAS